jgi:hypothetical protein
MALQNRVAPDGSIHAVDARGMLTGNRGIIHDAETRKLLKRRWTSRAWIACSLEFKGRSRKIMSPGSWTELFFLDEVTALAAGHRPCFECRRDDARRFARYFSAANGIAAARASDIDARLHDERLASTKRAPLLVEQDAVAGLPDGTMIACRGDWYAVRSGKLLRWAFDGYRNVPPPSGTACTLVTPPSTVAALRSGYSPFWHSSARACPPE